MYALFNYYLSLSYTKILRMYSAFSSSPFKNLPYVDSPSVLSPFVYVYQHSTCGVFYMRRLSIRYSVVSRWASSGTSWVKDSLLVLECTCSSSLLFGKSVHAAAKTMKTRRTTDTGYSFRNISNSKEFLLILLNAFFKKN